MLHLGMGSRGGVQGKIELCEAFQTLSIRKGRPGRKRCVRFVLRLVVNYFVNETQFHLTAAVLVSILRNLVNI